MQHTSGKIRIRVVPLGSVYTFADPERNARRATSQTIEHAPASDRHWTRLFRPGLRRPGTADT